MKSFVLVILLFFFSYSCSFAQISKARQIVDMALKKHTSGKILTNYILKYEHLKPGSIPSEMLQANPITIMLDSVMNTLSDSAKQQMQEKITTGIKKLLEQTQKYNGDERQYFFTDLDGQRTARWIVRTNEAKGKLDSTKMLLDWSNEYFFTQTFKMNPVALLQRMAHDSTELHYTGTAHIDGTDYNIVQVKLHNNWIDVYFNEKSYLLSRLVESKIDRDPILSQGPDPYKNIVYYLDFRMQDDFLIPGVLEEIDSRGFHTVRKKLEWAGINKPFPVSVFDAAPSDESFIKFRIAGIGNGLFVLERSSKWRYDRSLLRINQDKKIELLTSIYNVEKLNQQVIGAIKKEYQNSVITNIYNIDILSGVVSLSDFFDIKTHVFGPKGYGALAEEKYHTVNQKEAAAWLTASSAGLLTAFTDEFKTENVTALILNPSLNKDKDQIIVSYYLPAEKVIYFNGNPYYAGANGKNASLGEKLLYELIEKRQLPVEKIVYSGAYMDNAPLFMPFNEFEKRIKNTDFSIYKKWE